MAATFFDDEEAGDLALHRRCNQNRAGFRQGLHPCRGVGHVAIDLARRIHHYGAGFEADAGPEFRLSDISILAVQAGQSPLDRQRCARGALGVVLVRERIAEQRHQPVAELFGHMAAHLRHRRRGIVEISVDEVTPLLGIELSRNAGRIH
jgi:hypothetical protein